MYETLFEALDALSNLTSTGDALKADLMNLVGQVSVNAEGTVTVLYSGNVAGGPDSSAIIENMLDNDLDIRVVDKTVAAQLIGSEQFGARAAEAFGVDFETFVAQGSAVLPPNGLAIQPTAPGRTPHAGSPRLQPGTCALSRPKGKPAAF